MNNSKQKKEVSSLQCKKRQAKSEKPLRVAVDDASLRQKRIGKGGFHCYF